MSQYKNIASINQNRLFSGIDPESLKVNIKQGNFLEFQEGDIIYQKGDKDDSIYLIIEGEIKHKIKQGSIASTVTKKSRNDFFGENEFLEKTKRYSSAVANTNCLLFKLSRKDIIVIASEYRSILKNLSNNENFMDLDDGPAPETDESVPEEAFDIPDNESSEIDFNLPDETEEMHETQEEQINWEDQKFDTLNDYNESSLDNEIKEHKDIAEDETENEEQIKWDHSELDNIDDISEQTQGEIEEPETGIDSGKETRWDENQLGDLNNINNEFLSENPEQNESPVSDLEDDEGIKWETDPSDDMNNLEDEHLTSDTGESITGETNPEDEDKISWEDSRLEDIDNLNSGENLSTSAETESSEGIHWNENKLDDIDNLTDEHLTGDTEEDLSVESENPAADEISLEDGGLEDIDNLSGDELSEKLDENLSQLTDSETGDDILGDENVLENINNLNFSETVSESDSPLSGIEESEEAGYPEENPDIVNDEQINNLNEDFSSPEPGISISEEVSQTEEPDSGIPDETAEKETDEKNTWASDLNGEKESEHVENEIENYNETGIEETSEIPGENESSFGETAQETGEEESYESNEPVNEESETGLPEPAAAETNSIDEDLNIETVEEEEKPVIGIYNTGESGSEKELSDQDIYERVLRDLLYLYRSKNLQETVISVRELIKNFTGAGLVNFYLIDTETKVLDLIDVEDNNITHDKITAGEGLAASAVLNNEVINIQNPQEDSRFNPVTDSFGGTEISNILCYPVNNNLNEVVALFALANCIDGSFAEKDLKYMRAFSEHAFNHVNNIKQIENIPANVRIKATEEFSNFIVEDIKSPLLVIKHYADFIKRKAVPEELKIVSNYMLSQVDSVLSFSSIISDLINGGTSLNPVKCKLNELFDEILEMLAEYVDTRKVKLFKRYDSTASTNVDKSKFYHAMYQLTKIMCSNMPEGGSIYLVTTLRNNNIEIGLKDTGIGLPEQAEEILTKQFFDLSDIDELGMELSIAKKIIEDHGGKLELKKNSDKGTEFIIFLSVSEDT